MRQDSSAYLAHALHFTAEDLMANQQGVLSDAQRDHLQQEIAQNRSWSRSILVLMVLVYDLIFGIIIVTNRDYFSSNPKEARGLGIGIGVFVLALALSGVLTVRGYASTRQFRVHEVAGLAKRQTNDYEGFTYRIIEVNRVKFTVEEEVYQAFSDEQRYRIFYVRLFRRYLRILSAEELARPYED